MIPLIKRILRAAPTARVVGGDVVDFVDGKHVSYGRTISTGDGSGATLTHFQVSDAGAALLEAAAAHTEEEEEGAEPKARKRGKAKASDVSFEE